MPDKPKAPYAPIQNVLDVLHRMRDRGLPDRLDTNALQLVGVAEGNAARTLAALKFLGLVDEEARLTTLLTQLGKASTEEYPALLEGILRGAYAPVFQIVDPASDGDIAINDAFRQYDPVAQRTRMVTLFMGLCAEAGMIEAGAVRAPVRRVPARSQKAASKSRPPTKPTITTESTGSSVREPSFSLIRSGESKTIHLHGGGELTLHASVSFFALPREDRTFVFSLLDQLSDYESRLMLEGPKEAPKQIGAPIPADQAAV